MLWIKALHIIFVVTWFAGLFYLPRLFIYHVECDDGPGHERFVVMERRLFGIMTIGGVLAALFGLWLLLTLGGLEAPHWHWGWWYGKLILLMALIGYHGYTRQLMLGLRNRRIVKSALWYRWYNEVPTVFLVGIVILVVVKPF